MKKYAQNLTEKIISEHLVRGRMETGTEIFLKVDSTLVHDMSGTLAYIGFEAMGIDKIQVPAAVTFQDHNLVAMDHRSLDDHRFVASAARRYGSILSKAGNGICHSVYYIRIGRPGTVLAGADSHSATAGALGMLGVGLGGLDVSAIMGGEPMELKMPAVIGVEVKGRLKPGVSAKDAALWLLKQLSVKGGVGHVIEWGGPGIASLSVPERATITNMGTELGATTSVFPSDEVTRAFLKAQGREADFTPLSADPDAAYDRVIHIDLDTLEPLIACPHMPDKVVPVRSLKGVKVDQVCVGSCTNSSLYDLLKTAAMLKGRTVAPSVSMSVSPGSRQVLTMLANCGALSDILASGARLLECACGPCIGMGFSPNSGGVSLRTFNRNFEGRSGTADAKVYLVSPETAVAAALTGEITDPRDLGLDALHVDLPERFLIDDSAVLAPAAPEDAAQLEVLRGPNIKEFPQGKPVGDAITAKLTLKVGDNITTDHIMPAGSKILPYRSNIPKLSEFCFAVCDKEFAKNAKAAGETILVGGSNCGQGSSREHAALVPLYLGVRAVIAKSFARIHAANLINAGILPLTFADPDDYDALTQGETLTLTGIDAGLDSGTMTLHAGNREIPVCGSFTKRQAAMLRAGGLLNYTKEGND